MYKYKAASGVTSDLGCYMGQQMSKWEFSSESVRWRLISKMILKNQFFFSWNVYGKYREFWLFLSVREKEPTEKWARRKRVPRRNMAWHASDQLTNKSHDNLRVRVRLHQRSTALRRCLVVRLNLVEKKKLKEKEINDINRSHATKNIIQILTSITALDFINKYTNNLI